MNKKIIILLSIVFALSLILLISADWTPQSNINLRDLYNISNVPSYNGTNINLTGLYYGNGSQLTDVSTTETLWNANYTTFLTHINWSVASNGTLMFASNWNATNTSYYLVTNPFGFYNSTDFSISDYYLNNNPFGYYNSTNPSPETLWNANYSTFLTHIDWGEATNGTLYLSSNPSGYIDWSNAVNGTLVELSTLIGFGYYNSTDFSIGDYYLKNNPFEFWNDTYATFNKTYADNLYSTISEPLWGANYSTFLTISAWNDTGLIRDWNDSSLIIDWNATGYIKDWTFIEVDPFWLANYSAYNNSWSSTYNATYDLWAYNQTIPANLYTDSKLNTTFFNATNVNPVTGTPAGTVVNLRSYDGISYNLTEVSSDIELIVNFTGITTFNQLIFRYKSDVTESHNLFLYIWDYVNSAWESYKTIANTEGEYVIETVTIYDTEVHVSGGVVQVRFYSNNAGGATHLHQFDWV